MAECFVDKSTDKGTGKGHQAVGDAGSNLTNTAVQNRARQAVQQQQHTNILAAKDAVGAQW